ncbi:hypothetical protein CICLE_v10010622mg [Citrus x clementina]|uniref:TF-B3 domain-containing protein n=1 Tax=Citrus clementina TaxID=85681 RepID=V4TSF4_CITCL|nr:hypothetical protein CICLE_v10010622mg [Citrus x clementina]
MIKIKLTAEDVGGKRYYLDLKKAAVEEHIVKLWSPTVVKRATIDDIEVLLRDLDTSSKHNVNFRYYKHRDSYFLQGLWRKNFIKHHLFYKYSCTGYIKQINVENKAMAYVKK